jgi:hypothetical protein
MKKDQTLANNPTMDDDYLFASSATDCTGLIPSVTHDEYEAENYEEIYHYQPPVPPKLENLTANSKPEIGNLTSATPEMEIRQTTPEIGVPTTNPLPGVMPGADMPIPTTLR